MRFLQVFLPFLTCASVWAQGPVFDEWSLQFKVKSGFLAAHRGTMSHLYKDRVVAGEVSIYKRVYADKPWAESYKNPFVGFTLYGSNLGNREILGYGFGTYGFIEFPFARSKAHYLSAKLGAGLGFVTKVFDQQTNPKNVAVSSHVNALLCLGVSGRWQFSEKHSLIYGLDMTHFSNGASKVPNLGLNIPYISLGYGYRIGLSAPGSVEPATEIVKTPWLRNWKFTAIGILSSKEIFPTTGKNYPVFALSNMVHKRFREKVGMEVALDLVSKQSIFDYRAYIPKTQWTIFQVGAYIGYMLPLDRLNFSLGMGVYLKDRYDADDEFYHRVGMRYRFDNGLLLNLVLKSHWAKADYVEWGVGYTFNWKK
ncbi:MAG: acyloxyacyl hydrolase [Fluviicola sp.]